MTVNKYFRTLLATVLTATLSPTIAAAGAPEPEFTISEVPLTSEAHVRAGVAGGEGFQLIMGIAYSYSDHNIMYLGSDTSQVWKSVDSGMSWKPVNNGYAPMGSRSLFVHPSNPDVVLSAGTSGASFKKMRNKQPEQGIYRTTDGGQSWQKVHGAGFYRQLARGALFAHDLRTLGKPNLTVYAGTFDQGLLKSVDSGETWRKTGFKEPNIHDLVELPGRPGEFLVATHAGLYHYNSDSGKHAPTGTDLPDWPRNIAVSASEPGLVLAAVGKHGVYRSTDYGQTFERQLRSIPLVGEVTDIEISPVDANIAISIKSGKRPGPYFSHDGGRSWKPASSINQKGLADGGGFFFPSPIAMHPENSAIAVTSSNSRARVLRTEDKARNWFYSSSGYRGGRLRNIIFESSDEMIFNLTDHGPWETLNDGSTFRHIEIPRINGRSTSGGAISGDTFILAVGNWTRKEIITSRNRGRSWTRTGVTGRFKLVQAHRTRANTVYAGNVRSDDSGQTWAPLDHPVMAIDPRNNDIVYSLSATEAGAHLLQSRDAGATWTEMGNEMYVGPSMVNRLEIDPFVEGRIYAATSTGLRIFDNGRWRKRARDNGLLPDDFGQRYLETVVAHPNIPGLLFGGRRSPGKGVANGLFYSLDHGENWQAIAKEGLLTHTNIWSVNVNPFSDDAFVGTSHGIYRLAVKNRAGVPGEVTRPDSGKKP